MKVRIFTDDKRFYRMLELELCELGFEVISENGLATCIDAPIALCDLDFCDFEFVKGVSEFSGILGWSREEPDGNPSAQLCSRFFKRPFLMSELRDTLGKLLTGSNNVPTENISRRRSAAGLAGRKDILICNYQKREAEFGSYKISLTPTETEFLRLLCDERGKVVTRDELNAVLESPAGNIADVYMCKLRGKLDNRLGIKFIYTVRGKGYMLK